MSGYTPLFSSLITGTLCGKWPDIGLWPIILSLADKHGHVDVTPMYLAGVTGLPTQDVIDCMKRFCEPDPYSRTKTEAGARLVLIDDHRDWGWKIVNHGKYREKARLMAKDAVRTESGADAARKRQSPAVPRSPPASPSQTQTHTHTKNQRPDEIFRTLLKTSGKEPERTDRIQRAIDKVGGWPKIRNCTEYDLPQAERAFCEAYSESAPN